MRNEEGQVAVLVAVLFLALVFAVALVVNTGLLFVERRAAQGAADAAAQAGILRFAATDNPSLAAQAARDAALLNGFALTYTVSGSTVSGDINMPPVSGPRTGDRYYIEVVIRSNVSATLVPQWGATLVKARAVAGGGGIPAQAIYAVGSGNDIGLRVQSQGNIAMYRSGAPNTCTFDTSKLPGDPYVTYPGGAPCSAYGGEAQIDSTGSPAAWNSGGNVGPSTAKTAVVGSSATCATGTFPNLACQSPSLPDPFFPFPKPVPGSANWCRQDTSNLITQAQLNSVCGTYANAGGCPSGTSWVLQPGIYEGLVSGNCGNDPSQPWLGYLLKPGIYIFKGTASQSGIKSVSNLRILGSRAGDTFELVPGVPGPPGPRPPGGPTYQRDGYRPTDANQWVPGGCGPNATTTVDPPLCGVLLFFTYENYVSSTPTGGTCAEFRMSGGNIANLAPESTGTWGGMLVYYDPGPSTAPHYCLNAKITVAGGAALNDTAFRGLIYAPDANLDMNGANTVAIVSQIVVKSVVSGNGTLVVNVGTATTRVRAGFRLTE